MKRLVSLAVALALVGCQAGQQPVSETTQGQSTELNQPLPPASDQTPAAPVPTPQTAPPPASPQAATTTTTNPPSVVRRQQPMADTSSIPTEAAPRITIDQLRERMNRGEVVVVDVRSPEAYREQHIAGAINMPSDQIAARVGELPKEKMIVTYCT